MLRRAYADAGIVAPSAVPDGVELIRRRGARGSYLFAINHSDDPAEIGVAGTELFSGTPCGPTLVVAGGDVRVIRED